MFNTEDEIYVVAYTDGSGGEQLQEEDGIWMYSSGAGVHGYLYTNNDILDIKEGKTPTSKELKDRPWTKEYITSRGYTTSKQLEDGSYYVAPSYYIDLSTNILDTSNAAELHGVVLLLTFLITNNLQPKSILIHTDSVYVITQVTKLLNKEQLPPDTKNLDILLNINKLIDKLPNSTIELVKIKAHAGHLGNELADKLSKYGKSIPKSNFTSVVSGKIKDRPYWQPTLNHSPLLSHKRIVVEDGTSNIDNLLTLDIDTSSPTVSYRTGEYCVGLVHCKPITVTDIVMYPTITNNIPKAFNYVVINTNNLVNKYNTYYYNLFRNMGNMYKWETSRVDGLSICRNHMGDYIASTINNQPLLKDILNKLSILSTMLTEYKSKDNSNPNIDILDITDYIYEITDKGKYNCKLPLSTTYVDLTLKTKLYTKDLKIRLKLDIDTLSRSAYKNLEDSNPKVYILLHRYNEHNIRYYTVVETTDNEYGIYTNLFSSNILLKK